MTARQHAPVRIEPRVYHEEHFETEDAWSEYRWAKGQVGELLLGPLFYKPQPPRRIVDGHEVLAETGVQPTNFPVIAHHLDAVLFDDDTSTVEGILEIKTTITVKRKFRLNGSCGMFLEHAMRKSIPVSFGVVRLKMDFPKEIVDGEEAWLEGADLHPYVEECVVYDTQEFVLNPPKYDEGTTPMDPKRGVGGTFRGIRSPGSIRIKVDARPVFRWRPL